jgi:hypothetical protein
MKYRKHCSTIGVRKAIYEKAVERSMSWLTMEVDELKAEYLSLGHTPAMSSNDWCDCFRWLFLSEMKRMVGDI